MGLILRPEDLPSRVFYADTILRHQDPEDISKNEFFQIGAELIGKQGMEADAEVLLLLLEVLNGIGTPDYVVHLGCRGLFDATFGGNRALSESKRRAARRGVRLRNWSALREALEDSGRSTAAADGLAQLYAFIGDPGELETLLKPLSGILTEKEAEAVSETRRLYELLAELGADDRVRLDFSEIGNQPYHTGVAFQVYMDGLDSAVAAGGRYDGLLSVFGLDAPSVGFSVMLRKIQDLLGRDHELFEVPKAERATGKDFAERVGNARTMRSQGRTTIL
jgi:ATP phosphoribosyltransferase regulatory subunit